jgi:hypothetical protein
MRTLTSLSDEETPMLSPLSRRSFGLAAAATLVASLAACGSSTPTGSGTLAGNGTPTVAVSASASAPASAPATPTTPAAAPPPAAAYPSNYAKAILDAWAAKNASRLTQLTSSHDSDHLINDLGSTDQHWTHISDDGAMGSTYATYYNAKGDAITIQIQNEGLSEKKYHVGRVDSFDKMSYPSDANAYVTKFVDGWISGNKQRMILLSSNGVTSHFLSLTRPDSEYQVADVPGSGSAGHIELEIKESSAGLDQTVLIADPVLGSAHAIEDCDPSCG